jgi:hypothetical protein
MESILRVKDFEFKLTNEVQFSNKNRPFRLSSISKNETIEEKWVLNSCWELKNHWIYSFIFLDEIGGFISIELGYYDELINIKK